MHKDDGLKLRQRQIRTSQKMTCMKAKAVAARMECASNGDLRTGVLPSYRGHHSGSCPGVDNIRHGCIRCFFQPVARIPKIVMVTIMKNTFGIVDLFSGPGGLGEGFCSFRSPSCQRPFRLEVSIEKDGAAYQTLLLRSFLRNFDLGFPDEYEEFLDGQIDEPDWSTLYPKQWAKAERETWCMELGEEETSRLLSKRIRSIKRRYGDRTILIGGPPCQAYSLVGRSRNAGISDYVPHEDERHFLYEEYVKTLLELRPAVFVMENVKGMLSSTVRGDRILEKVLSDLRFQTRRTRYRLVALSGKIDGDLFEEPGSLDFVVRSEDYGIPQARHRVIIVGIRQDLADGAPAALMPRLEKHDSPSTVRDVLGDLPRMRSGLSTGDEESTWREHVLDAVKLIRGTVSTESEECALFESTLDQTVETLASDLKLRRKGSVGADLSNSCPASLSEWIAHPSLDHLPNHETRGHMVPDLARYLFAAAYGETFGRSPKASEFPAALAPNHRNWDSGKFADRFRVQVWNQPARTVTSHISKDGHYYIHPDPVQCRSLTVREAARLQTFPDNYFFKGNRTQQYVQVGNAVPPFLAHQIAESLWPLLRHISGEIEASGISSRTRTLAATA